MIVQIYPGDSYGCGYHRLIWPAKAIQKYYPHDATINIIEQKQRQVQFSIKNNSVSDISISEDIDVVVFQRVTHRFLAEVIPILRDKGISVVVDVDDDLNSIHPSNPAWERLHPANENRRLVNGNTHMHSWKHLNQSCKNASLVTTSTQILQKRYAAHGRGYVLNNYLAEHYYGISREKDTDIGWPASLHSHPDDPTELGNSLTRLVESGHTFKSYGQAKDVTNAFNLHASAHDDPVPIELEDWPYEISRFKVGICPLTDTKFNVAKSWLKPLELSAVGVPWIGSPRVEYERLQRMGCGLLAEKPKQWHKMLAQLLNDDAMNKEQIEAGYDIAQQLQLKDHCWRWLEAWNHALELDKKDKRVDRHK